MAQPLSDLVISASRLGRATCACAIASRIEVWGPAVVAIQITAVRVGFVAALLVAAVVAATTWIAGGRAGVQQRIADERRRRARSARRDRRETRLEEAGVRRDEILELVALVDLIARDASDARCDDLEDLLDCYADAAIARARYAWLARAGERARLVRALRAASQPTAAPARRHVLERRLAAWEAYDRRSLELADQIATLAELLRLMAARAIAPPGA